MLCSYMLCGYMLCSYMLYRFKIKVELNFLKKIPGRPHLSLAFKFNPPPLLRTSFSPLVRTSFLDVLYYFGSHVHLTLWPSHIT